MIGFLTGYLPLLLLTLAIELFVIRIAAPRDRRRAALETCLALNLLTHPVATLLSWTGRVDVFSLELLVFALEWLGYSKLLELRSIPALRYALLPNVLSALAGAALWIASVR